VTDDLPRSGVPALDLQGSANPAADEGYLRTDSGEVFRIHARKPGGMGIVYLCSPAEMKASVPLFALKTFDDKFFFNSHMQTSMRSEGKLWMRVSGLPYVLPLLGMVSCNRKSYLVMPAINPTAEGDVSLSNEIARCAGGLSPRRCLSLATHIATALSECVDRVPDLVHGDIKPDNILLMPDGSPMLADFGMARLSSESPYTATARGTSEYRAPECWVHPAFETQLADIYAFGATLFEMLTGHTPFVKAIKNLANMERMHRDEPVRFDTEVDEGSLDAALRVLALDCLNKDPRARPSTAGALLGRLRKMGLEHEPVSVLIDIMQSKSRPETGHYPDIVISRVEALLRHGDGKTAVAILEDLSSEQLEGWLLKLYGSALSLANRDEEALAVFDRYLAWEKDEVRCFDAINEKGLSLKRLKRLPEARVLYESAIYAAPKELQVMLRGNYAATLLEQGEKQRAVWVAKELAMRNPDSHEAWGLLGQALWSSRDWRAGIDAAQRATELAPEVGRYRVLLAKSLMGVHEMSAALAALDVAYGLGHHTEEWLVRMLACTMRVCDQEAMDSCLAWLRESITEEEAQRALDDAREMLTELDRNGEGGENVDVAAPTQRATSATEDRTLPPPGDFRTAVRAGAQPYVQIRTSHVDGTMLLDFYYDVQNFDYAQVFAESVLQIKVHSTGAFGLLTQRAKPYAFARCSHCGAHVLTQRDEGERYRCQGCDTDVAVVVVHDTRLDRLLDQATQAAGFVAQHGELGSLFVAIAPTSEEQRRTVTARFTDTGYTLVPSDRAVYERMRLEAHQRLLEFPDEMQVWLRQLQTPHLSLSEDGTPQELDRLLRHVRRETGPILSCSTTINDPKLLASLMSSDEDYLNAKIEAAYRAPHDLRRVRHAIEAATLLKRIDDARALLALMRANAHQPEYDAALGTIALAEGDHETAVASLERALAARPLDHTARVLLVRAYQALGDWKRVAAHISRLRSHGVFRPPRGSMASE